MKRQTKQRKTNDTVLILTNGKKTEKDYFNAIPKKFDCLFTIKVEYKNLECDKLVEHAIEIGVANYNQIWCVFDIDDSFTEGHLTAALALARRNGIKIAYSNEAFEVWLLYHLEDSVKESLSRRNYIREINSILSNNNSNFEFKKNDCDLLENKFAPNALMAAERAKKKYQQKEAEHKRMYDSNSNYRIWEWRSTTTVFKLIDALELKRKDC